MRLAFYRKIGIPESGGRGWLSYANLSVVNKLVYKMVLNV
jgi:hypothetical protein